MIRIMIENGETFIWIFGFALKSVEVGATGLTGRAYIKVRNGGLEGLGH